MNFTCNICGAVNAGVEPSGREGALCASCGSSMRHRCLMAVLTREIFGVALSLDHMPVLKSLRGLGLSDTEVYARVLTDRFSYRNTYLDREPILDIADPGTQDAGTLDFLLASEVFEHVRPPVEQALRNALELLRPDGVLVMTVPYELAGETREHYPELCDYGIASLRSGHVLVNRTSAGELQVFSDLVFHGGAGSTLELRCFSEPGLRKVLADAGFAWVCFHPEDYPEFGVAHQEAWSLPLVARRRAPESNLHPVREMIERNSEEWKRVLCAYQDENRRIQEELSGRTAWVQAVERRMTSDIEERTQWAKDLEAQLAERTEWARRMDQHLKKVEELLRRTHSSIWYRIGRKLGLAPGGDLP